MMMIFVFDVGNTNTVLGVYDGDELKYHWRIETNRNKTEDEYGMTIKALFEHANLPFHDITGLLFHRLFLLSCLPWKICVKSIFILKPLSCWSWS